MQNLNEQLLRMKQLMGEDRLYGNLVNDKTEENILKEEWYNIKKDIFGFTGELLESDDKLFNSQNLLIENLFVESKNELIKEQNINALKNLIFKPKMKGKKIKLKDMTLSSGFSPFKNLKGSGLADVTYRNLDELVEIFKKNKTSVLNAMKNTGAGGWKDATMKHMDTFITDLEEVMTNANQYLNPNNRFSPAKTTMSSRSKRMVVELPSDMVDDIFVSVEFIGKRQKLKNYYTKIKNKVGGWYDKTKNFIKKVFRTTDASGLKKRWSSKPVSSLKLTDKELMAQFATGIRKSLDEAGANIRGRLNSMDPDFVINEMGSKLKELENGSIGGLVFREVNGKYELVRQIEWIDPRTGKRKTKKLMNDETMEAWLSKGTKSSDNPKSEKLTKSKWWIRGNTKGKTRGVPGSKIFNFIGRVLQYPFPVGGSLVRLIRETGYKLVGKGDFKRVLPIGERGNLKQLSDLAQGNQPAFLKMLGAGSQWTEVGIRGIVVETLIYCTGYGVWQEQDPKATKLEKTVQSTKDFVKHPTRYWAKGALIKAELWNFLYGKGKEAIKSIDEEVTYAYCSKKYPNFKNDDAEMEKYVDCVNKIKDSKTKISNFINAQEKLIESWNKSPMDCTKITEKTWTNIMSTKADAEMELNKSIPWWKDTKKWLNRLGYKGNVKEIEDQMFPKMSVPKEGDTTGATKEVSWDEFVGIAKQRWRDECQDGGNRNNQHGDGNNIKRNTDDDSKCSCVGRDGKKYEYDCTGKFPEECNEDDIFSYINLPEIEVTSSQYDYNPNMKIVFETAAVDNIAFLDESDFS
jgi:hypothetical protein